MKPTEIRILLNNWIDFQAQTHPANRIAPKSDRIEWFADHFADEPDEIVPPKFTEEDFVREIISITQVDPIRLKTDFKTHLRPYVLARQLHIVTRWMVYKMSLTMAAEPYNKIY